MQSIGRKLKEDQPLRKVLLAINKERSATGHRLVSLTRLKEQEVLEKIEVLLGLELIQRKGNVSGLNGFYTLTLAGYKLVWPVSTFEEASINYSNAEKLLTNFEEMPRQTRPEQEEELAV